MSSYTRDTHFLSLLDEFVKINNKKELRKKAKQLEAYVIQINSPSAAYRLSFEIDNTNIIPTKRLQNLIINNGDPRYIFRFAYDIRGANIPKLQAAIIRYGDILQIAKFGCFVRGADKLLIENLIAQSNSAKSCYLYLKFVKSCDVEKLKHIVMKSNRPRYLYALIKRTNNKIDFDKIQDLILNAHSFLYKRLMARYVKGADVDKIVEHIVGCGDMSEIKKLHKLVKHPRLEKLSILF